MLGRYFRSVTLYNHQLQPVAFESFLSSLDEGELGYLIRAVTGELEGETELRALENLCFCKGLLIKLGGEAN